LQTFVNARACNARRGGCRGPSSNGWRKCVEEHAPSDLQSTQLACSGAYVSIKQLCLKNKIAFGRAYPHFLRANTWHHEGGTPLTARTEQQNLLTSATATLTVHQV